MAIEYGDTPLPKFNIRLLASGKQILFINEDYLREQFVTYGNYTHMYINGDLTVEITTEGKNG